MTVSRQFQIIGLSGEKESFFRAAGSGNYIYHRPTPVHHHLCFARLYRSSRRAKVTDATSGKLGTGCKVCDVTDDPVSFKSDV